MHFLTRRPSPFRTVKSMGCLVITYKTYQRPPGLTTHDPTTHRHANATNGSLTPQPAGMLLGWMWGKEEPKYLNCVVLT